MRVTIDLIRQGSQERPYGPNVYEFFIILTSQHAPYHVSVFDRWARKIINWSDEPKWYEWRLVERQQIGEDMYWYRVEQPYDD